MENNNIFVLILYAALTFLILYTVDIKKQQEIIINNDKQYKQEMINLLTNMKNILVEHDSIINQLQKR